MAETLAAAGGGKVILLLNFPNNPTGYSPTTTEAGAIVAAVAAAARSGTRILVVCDDAYFGLFYEPETFTQSLFARFCDLDERVLAAKVDGSTKEDLTWGFRTGFITLGAKGLGEPHYEALTRKLMGAVRSTVSSSSVLAQNLVLRAVGSPTYGREKREAYETLRERYVKVKAILAARPRDLLQPLPFNSGYFMSFRLAEGEGRGPAPRAVDAGRGRYHRHRHRGAPRGLLERRPRRPGGAVRDGVRRGGTGGRPGLRHRRASRRLRMRRGTGPAPSAR